MSNVVVTTTTMGFSVGVTPKGMIKGCGFSILEYIKKFEHCKFDRGSRQWIIENSYFYFDKDNETCYFPKYDLPRFVSSLQDKNVTVEIIDRPPVKGKDIDFLMLPWVEYKNDKQKGAIEFLTDPRSGTLRGLALRTGTGKLQPLYSFIKTPEGWTQMGNIRLGQMLTMPDGTVAPVKGIYPQGEVDIYRVYFEDGRWTDCGLEHLWKVFYINWPDRWRVLTTSQIIDYMKNNVNYRRRMYVPLIEPEIMDDIDLPIDPYVLGVILGDGNIYPRSVVICKPDDWLRIEVNKNLPLGYSVSKYGPDGKSFHIVRNGVVPRPSFAKYIEDLGLTGKVSDTKSIPDIYMRASPRQKLALIQGLMDTYGTVGIAKGRNNSEIQEGKGGNITYCTVSEIMAKQVQEIIRSLGGLCKIRTKNPFYYNKERVKVPGKLAYILPMRMKDPSSLFRLPRKKERCPHDYQYKDTLRLRISSIELIGPRPAQCIEVDHPDHLYITDDYIVTHNTVAFIWSLQLLSKRSMITMTSRLDQWVGELVKYTTLEEDDIYVVQGLGSLTKLFSQIDKTYKPKVILMSTKTIRLYLDYGPAYQHLPHPSQMCEELGIGIVGTDEYHEHFYTNFLIGLMLNPEIFIPITATFLANDPFVKNIFDSFIPKDIQFEGGEYDRYIKVTAYKYESGGYLIKPWNYTTRNAYSQVKFEEFLLSKKGSNLFDSIVRDAILPIVREHYIDIAEDKEKFLLLCDTKVMCDTLQGIFRRHFNSKTVSVFYGGMSSTILEKFDMIISTPGSAGTGRDIKNLRTCFSFVNTGSEIRNIQFMGRLRPYPAVKNTPEYVYLSLTCIPQHQKYASQRAMLYGPRALSFRHRSIR